MKRIKEQKKRGLIKKDKEKKMQSSYYQYHQRFLTNRPPVHAHQQQHFTRNAEIEQAAVQQLGMTPEQVKATTIHRLQQQLENNRQQSPDRRHYMQLEPTPSSSSSPPLSTLQQHSTLSSSSSVVSPSSSSSSAQVLPQQQPQSAAVTISVCPSNTSSSNSSSNNTYRSTSSKHSQESSNSCVVVQSPGYSVLAEVLQEIERDFGPCFPTLTKYLNPVRAFFSSAQFDALHSYFSEEERERLKSSINAKDACGNLSRILLHIYERRIEYMRRMSDLLTKEELNYWEQRHESMYALMNRFQQTFESVFV